jgi:replication factor C subunit 1
VCKEAGFEPLEFNASDTRTKTTLAEKVMNATSSRGISEFFTKIKDKDKQPTCIIMDEVDGMSTGDRGGIAELISMIKKTQVPIICVSYLDHEIILEIIK